MNKNFITSWFNAAMKQVKAGTSAVEFATNYANASQAEKGSSLWQQNYEAGLKQFETIDFHAGSKGVIDDAEMSVIGLYVERMNGKGVKLPDNIETFSGNSMLEDFRASEGSPAPKVNPDIDEVHHLKPVDVMTKEELEAEMAQYKQLGLIETFEKAYDESEPETEKKGADEHQVVKVQPKSSGEVLDDNIAFNADMKAKLKAQHHKNTLETLSSEEKELNQLRKQVSGLRAKRNMIDKNSDIVDFHIGTFNQGGLGSCSMLAQLNGLSDEQLKRIIKKKTDNNGKIYYEVTFPIDAGTKNSVIVTEAELSNREITVTDGKQTQTVSAFSTGDTDVTLMEMAYIKRFGINPVVNGGDFKFLNDIFTFPDENRTHVGTSYEVTEDKLIKAMRNGEHLSLGLHHTSRLPGDFSYTDSTRTVSGITTQWKYEGKNERADVLSRLKAMLEKYGSNGDKVDISEYEKMSDAELMDATYRFVSQDFWFTARLELSNGYSIIEDHAYSLKAYDPVKKELTLVNPHNSNEDIIIPLEIAQKFFDISG
ncbi:hypothetical protein IKP85_03085 [bacterium]|nr:hypothetical protein [bacterium]